MSQLAQAGIAISGVDSVGGGGGSGKNSYRNTGDVFSLEGEDDEEDETEELVSVSTWQRDALSSYPCSLLLGDDNQQTPGHLIIRVNSTCTCCGSAQAARYGRHCRSQAASQGGENHIEKSDCRSLSRLNMATRTRTE
uniref:Uncharacterized protein n=1 Tax=Macrostomum lignano TaxID=282301 RepID=A0A1I8FNB7_9PLAT